MDTSFLTASPPVVDPDLPGVVAVSGFFYQVSLGSGATRRIHSVLAGSCSCPLGTRCPAVALVEEYLEEGGEHAPAVPDNYYPLLPACCPLCGSQVHFAPFLTSPHRGLGWVCERGGAAHYWRSFTFPLPTRCGCSAYTAPHIAGSGHCPCSTLPLTPESHRRPV